MPQDTCRTDACDEPAKVRGWCRRHYKAWLHQNRVHGTPAPPGAESTYEKRSAMCKAADCDEPVLAKGLCTTHYQRMQRLGTVDLPERASVEERLRRKVREQDGCWVWTGATVTANASTYPALHALGEVLAHRVSYRLFKGPIPEETPHIDHLCFTTLCVNPEHLEAVTPTENNRRSLARRADT